MIPLFKFKIKGNSMNPTFREGNVVLVNRFSYFLGRPKIGDLIILKRRQYIIKRIKKIEDDKYFVVGDNRKESTDSREFGWVSKKEIVGKVFFKI